MWGMCGALWQIIGSLVLLNESRYLGNQFIEHAICQKGPILADFSYLPGPGTPVNLAPGHPNLIHVGNVWGPMANNWFPSTFK
jgi:hypothetical protein